MHAYSPVNSRESVSQNIFCFKACVSIDILRRLLMRTHFKDLCFQCCTSVFFSRSRNKIPTRCFCLLASGNVDDCPEYEPFPWNLIWSEGNRKLSFLTLPMKVIIRGLATKFSGYSGSTDSHLVGVRQVSRETMQLCELVQFGAFSILTSVYLFWH